VTTKYKVRSRQQRYSEIRIHDYNQHRGAYDLSVKPQKMANEFGNLDLLPLAFLDRELFLMVSFKLGGSLVGGFSSEVEAL
jgi:hypothetical protein